MTAGITLGDAMARLDTGSYNERGAWDARPEAVLERARDERVYVGRIPVMTAMADLDKALKGGADGEAEAGVLVAVIADRIGDDTAAYVSGSEGGES